MTKYLGHEASNSIAKLLQAPRLGSFQNPARTGGSAD